MKTQKKRTFRVYRYWPVEYCSVAEVEASSVEDAIRLGLEDDDYSDAESVDGSEGPTEVGKVVEINDDGDEIEHEID